MFTQKTAKISIKDKIADTLSSRDIVDYLDDKIKETKSDRVIIDFNNVEFISRSAAHELYILKNKYRNKFFRKKEIIFDNYNKNIDLVLKRVIRKNKKRDAIRNIDVRDYDYKKFFKEA